MFDQERIILLYLIDIVLDNSAYELLMDLCLMTAITAYFKRNSGNSRFKVRFHVKSIPWFISDVTVPDFNWTLDQLVNHEDSSINLVGRKWRGTINKLVPSLVTKFVVEFLTDGTWEIMPHPFWTLPCEYKYMPDYAPDLYELLSSSAMVIFKGDLNYRLEPSQHQSKSFKLNQICLGKCLVRKTGIRPWTLKWPFKV